MASGSESGGGGSRRQGSGSGGSARSRRAERRQTQPAYTRDRGGRTATYTPASIYDDIPF